LLPYVQDPSAMSHPLHILGAYLFFSPLTTSPPLCLPPPPHPDFNPENSLCPSSPLCGLVQVLYSIPGADITNAPTWGGTLVLNLIFIFGLLVSHTCHTSHTAHSYTHITNLHECPC